MSDKTIEAVAVFNKLATLYAQKYMDVSGYSESLEKLGELLHASEGTVLELGCGPGNITRFMLDRFPHLKITGIDLAPDMIAIAKSLNPEATFEVMDCREINKIDSKFDAILCGFCLPYLSRLEAIQLISDSAVKLKTAGVIYISTMEDNNSKSGYVSGSTGDKIFMNYHECSYLTEALRNENFEVVYEKHLPLAADPENITKDLVLIAKKIA
ncbi:MAG: Trans-aconitate 2-methyltransferase [Bacteroidetes bacterium ADurb.Bin397]|jgi:predicted TPR repeat methyltransferase|nr:MAG: Trans-aconitate 2-methyltransferase [Bacteroidetes bacterium ADurb.Bin397]